MKKFYVLYSGDGYLFVLGIFDGEFLYLEINYIHIYIYIYIYIYTVYE